MTTFERLIAAIRAAEGRVPDDLSPLERRLVRICDVAAFGVRKLGEDRAPLLAAALAYRTIFSLIPVLVLALMFLRGFYEGDVIRPALNSLLDYLAIDQIAITTEGVDGAEAQSTEVADFVNEFIVNAESRLAGVNYGAITIVGIAIFFYAALSLLIQIEHAFNAVMRAPTGRSFMVRLTNYWTLLTLGSLALFVSFTVSNSYAERLDKLPVYLVWLTPVVKYASTVGVAWILLLFAYTQMPNTRVRIRTAAIGALISAVLWEVSKGGLTWFMKNAVSGQVTVYGSLAIVPLLMFWIYVTWLVILFGLEVAAILQSARLGTHRLPHQRRANGPTLVDPAIAVPIMAHIAERFAAGDATDPERIARATGLTELQLEPIVAALLRADLLHRVDLKKDEDAFALARPAETITINEILTVANRVAAIPEDDRLSGSLVSLERCRADALASVSLADHIRGLNGKPA